MRLMAAGGKDVSLAGAANAAQQYLDVGLVDKMEINLSASGERLFDGLRDNLRGLELVRTVAAPKGDAPQIRKDAPGHIVALATWRSRTDADSVREKYKDIKTPRRSVSLSLSSPSSGSLCTAWPNPFDSASHQQTFLLNSATGFNRVKVPLVLPGAFPNPQCSE